MNHQVRELDFDRVGKNLLKLRQERDWTLLQLQHACGIQCGSLCKYENSHMLPTLPVVLRLCVALGCTINDIVEGV